MIFTVQALPFFATTVYALPIFSLRRRGQETPRLTVTSKRTNQLTEEE